MESKKRIHYTPCPLFSFGSSINCQTLWVDFWKSIVSWYPYLPEDSVSELSSGDGTRAFLTSLALSTKSREHSGRSRSHRIFQQDDWHSVRCLDMSSFPEGSSPTVDLDRTASVNARHDSFVGRGGETTLFIEIKGMG